MLAITKDFYERASVLNGFARSLAQTYLPLPPNTLINTPRRTEIRADFPEIQWTKNLPQALKIIKQELKKLGLRFNDVKRINIAYPHKHPEIFKYHINEAEGIALRIQQDLKKLMPKIDWVTADSICETVHLRRSEKNSSVHTLIRRQNYEIFMPLQKQSFPFAQTPPPQNPEIFILADWSVSQGTTMANLMSYITNNGGIVLAAIADFIGNHNFVQKCPSPPPSNLLKYPFNDRSRNTALLPALAQVFSESTRDYGFDNDPQKCIELFEEKLNRIGHSVFALTDGECENIILDYRDESFIRLIETLDHAPT